MINSYDYTLQTLVVEKDYLFEIPNYQRSYVWTEKEILLFLNDGKFCMSKYIESEEKFEHYAGQMIFRKLKEERDTRCRMEVIDGQQRLTTFMLLVLAAIKQLETEENDLQRIEELKKEYLVSCSSFNICKREKKLRLSKKDSVFWDELVDGKVPMKEDTMLKSQIRLLEAYGVIETYLAEMTSKLKAEQKGAELTKFIHALAESFRLVVLMSEDPGHEFALFQIVNDRGLPLTSGELLKARTIELLTSQKKELRRERIILEAEEIWADILQDDGATTEKFLIWNYIAILGKKTESTKKLSIREQYERDIFHCLNKREISMDNQDEMLEKLKQLRQIVQMCRALEMGEFPVKCEDGELNLLLGILIRNMKNTFVIPLYLHLLDNNKEKKALKIAELLTPMLIKTYFQAKVMGNVNDESIQNCYLDIWKILGEKEIRMEEIRECLTRLLDKKRCKEEFYRRIEQDIYDRSSSNLKAKFLLLMVELQYLQEGENHAAHFGDDSVQIAFDKLSIEHILCESVNENEVSKDFYASIHKIGNLTLLGRKLNSREKAKSFKEKKAHYLLSPYFITREVGKLEDWRMKEFRERQGEMINVLKRAFEL